MHQSTLGKLILVASQIIRLDESFLKEWSEDLLFASLTGSMVDKSFLSWSFNL